MPAATETPSRGEPVEKEPSTSGEKPIGTANLLEIDDAFKAAAIYGLYEVKSSNAQRTITLPLPSSTLISNHLNPYLPHQFAQYTFKKTSWKKAATFLKKYMEKEGLVKTKDRGGEPVIISINWDHKFIAEFKPYRLDKKEGNKGTPGGDQSSNTSTSAIQIRELYKPSGKALKTILEALSKSYTPLQSS
jgi:translation initiation factor 2D